MDADEIVVAFASYAGSTVPKQIAGYKELKGFQRARIPAGVSVRVQIPIRVSDLWYWDYAAKRQTVAPDEATHTCSS